MSSFDAWIGRAEVSHDTATAAPVRLMAATLGRAPVEIGLGLPVPPGWHWLYFLSAVPTGSLGPDGHPPKGDFLPPIPLPRRMRAGGEMLFHRPVRVGDALRRESTIRSVTEKQGSAGRLVFLTVEHAIFANDQLALTEKEDIVYREASTTATPAPVGSAGAATVGTGDEQGTKGTRFHTDPVLLFRTSALTFNGHRIHYDLDYAKREEGYPERVVHGPLIALMMMEHIGRVHAGALLTQFRYKALAPTFCGQSILIVDRDGIEPGLLQLEARNSGGALAVSGVVTLAR